MNFGEVQVKEERRDEMMETNWFLGGLSGSLDGKMDIGFSSDDATAHG
eukprot:CAMPEP_0119135938 /NCGR_PEP_ID=MMETSP1310-20130426/20384_1 /TAXON_ID=464262 /ORGANISM="Genus nov. species nov., Strain RCC2339" /LENGTH=47 /DNA_ID= /DNA_START= /DNA_END= /DNA_ORIENTATION=